MQYTPERNRYGHCVESQNPISRIKEQHQSLRKSERKVADFILDRPASIINMRIVDVAGRRQ